MESPATIETHRVQPRLDAESLRVPSPRRCFLLGLPFDRATLDETVEDCVRAMRAGRPRYLATPNVDFTRCAASNRNLSGFLMRSWRNTCDGLPLVWFSRLLGDALPERVAGSDLTPKLLERCAREGFGVFFLGSDSDTLERAAEKLVGEYPEIDIRGWHAPPFGPVSDWDHAAIFRKIREAHPDLVLVATGSPKQEEWISRYQETVGVSLCIGVGASLDFVTGKQVRAPRLVQRIGMEWFWRLSGSPKRLLGRYAADFGFFFQAAFRQWRLHRFWKAAESAPPAPDSDWWEVLDVAHWLGTASDSEAGGFPDGPLLLDTRRLESFDHGSFNRFGEAVVRHRQRGHDCVLWNPPRLLENVIETFGWRWFLPAAKTRSEVEEVFTELERPGAWESASGNSRDQPV